MASRPRAVSLFTIRPLHATLGLSVLLGFFGAGLLVPSGCTLDVAGVASETTGAGGGAVCMVAAECDDANVCTLDDCVSGACVHPNADAAAPDDGNDCTADTCIEGMPKHTPQSGPCGQGDLLMCNAQGQCMGCTTAEQCGQTNECEAWSCNGDTVCVTERKPNGFPLPDPTDGDCMTMVCDGIGHAVASNDDGDLPLPDAVECTGETCLEGVPSYPLSAVGAMACVDPAKVCNAAGACVTCTGSFGCTARAICFEETACVSCMDGAQNGSETGADCGGAECGQCEDGLGCLGPDDCLSGDCNGGVCISCGDQVRNGTETDVDCGGSCPEDCMNGSTCSSASDCVSPNCVDGVCCATVCTGTCRACNLPGHEGTCTDLPEGVDDLTPTCSDTMTCDGAGSCVGDQGQGHVGDPCDNNSDCLNDSCQMGGGVCKLDNDDPCAADAECKSTNCENNVCKPL